MSNTISMTVIETIEYEITVDTSDGFPDGYDFDSDPDDLLDSYVADITSSSDGSEIVNLERDITING